MRQRIAVIVITLFTLASAALADTVRGKVVYPDGSTPYANVAIKVTGAAGSSETVFSGSDGLFQLENVPPGNYTMELKTRQETKNVPISVQKQAYTDLPLVKMK
jgi:hypothetical protein